MKTCPQCKMRYPNEATFCFVDGADLVPLEDPRVGTSLAGRYVIEDVIGEGGMATVYRARHKLIDAPCAVKIMSPHARDRPGRPRALPARGEERAEARPPEHHRDLRPGRDRGRHRVHRHGAARGARRSPTSIAQGADRRRRARSAIMIQIARGIARAHDFDVIHRDLKPENIFLCRARRRRRLVKLLDFGIARSRRTRASPARASSSARRSTWRPSASRAATPGPSVDLYALGVIFFEMLTGQAPVRRARHRDVLRQAPEGAAAARRASSNPRVPASSRRSSSACWRRTRRRARSTRTASTQRSRRDRARGRRRRSRPEPGDRSGELARRQPARCPRSGSSVAKRTQVFEQMLAQRVRRNAPAASCRARSPSVKAHVRRIVELAIASDDGAAQRSSRSSSAGATGGSGSASRWTRSASTRRRRRTRCARRRRAQAFAERGEAGARRASWRRTRRGHVLGGALRASRSRTRSSPQAYRAGGRRRSTRGSSRAKEEKRRRSRTARRNERAVSDLEFQIQRAAHGAREPRAGDRGRAEEVRGARSIEAGKRGRSARDGARRAHDEVLRAAPRVARSSSPLFKELEARPRRRARSRRSRATSCLEADVGVCEPLLA